MATRVACPQRSGQSDVRNLQGRSLNSLSVASVLWLDRMSKEMLLSSAGFSLSSAGLFVAVGVDAMTFGAAGAGAACCAATGGVSVSTAGDLSLSQSHAEARVLSKMRLMVVASLYMRGNLAFYDGKVNVI